MPPEQREAKNATRTAFGADYEQRIRAEAGDEPEKKAKRKHQIHSLYHQAKMKVSSHNQALWHERSAYKDSLSFR